MNLTAEQREYIESVMDKFDVYIETKSIIFNNQDIKRITKIRGELGMSTDYCGCGDDELINYIRPIWIKYKTQ